MWSVQIYLRLLHDPMNMVGICRPAALEGGGWRWEITDPIVPKMQSPDS